MELINDQATREKYSRDASLFKVVPKYVATPKDVAEMKQLVAYAKEHGESLTMRAGGSDMSGGSLSESIVVDVKNFNAISEVTSEGVRVGPGTYYRDLEKKTLEKGLLLPCYPASKNLAALGGMIGNNCGGELSLRYGKMENFIEEAKWLFTDGNEYLVKPLTTIELEAKMAQGDFEGNLYKQTYDLLRDNKRLIQEAKPQVTKNSAGYYFWNVQSRTLHNEETFDLNKLLVGSQGTLGILTEAKLRLVPVKPHHDLIALFFTSWNELPAVVNAILPYQPESLETFDEETLKLGIHFMPEIAKRAGKSLFSFAAQFLPEAWIGVKMGGLPQLIVLVEVVEASEGEVQEKREKILEALKPFAIHHRVIEKDSEEAKFWVMRRESFNLLRQHSGDKRAAPFIDDFCVPTSVVPEFLPQVKAILEKHGIRANIAGHAGEGNFHIIPLMDLKDERERAKIIPVANEIYALVAKYKGSTTGEHNDGIMRTPYLSYMYRPEILALFAEVKQIFDPQNIFNPGKKVPSTHSGEAGSFDYLTSHLDFS